MIAAAAAVAMAVVPGVAEPAAVAMVAVALVSNHTESSHIWYGMMIHTTLPLAFLYLWLGLPPPPEKDAYLRSRVERFYAEVKDYRPGTLRLDMADKSLRDGPPPQAGREGVGGTEGERPGGSRRRYYEGGKERQKEIAAQGGMHKDGSFAGHSASQYAGLGANSNKEEEQGDAYSEYRKTISSSYHDMIVKGDGVSNVARGGR